jgi:hypothetical protein
MMRRRMGGDRDDGIAASIAIGSVRSRSIGRSVGRSTAATAATFGGARARWSGDLKRELNFGSVRDSISIRVRSRSVVPVVDRARDHGRTDR